MKTLDAALIALMLCGSLYAIDPPPQHDFYVTTDGNDAWDGSAGSHGENNNGPFATIARAQKAVRELKATLAKEPRLITVSIGSGTHYLKETWTLEPQDSGTEKIHIIYVGQDGAVISGGVKLDGFKADDKGRWQLTIPEVQRGEWTFSELFVNGRRCYRPRTPKDGFNFIQGELQPSDKPNGKGFDRFVFSSGALDKNWHNLIDVEIMPFQNWTMSRFRIAEIDDEKRSVLLSGKTPSNMDWNRLARGRRFIVENVFEALDMPGQWYLDNKSGVLTYIPTPEDIAVGGLKSASIFAPRLERLVEIKGGFTPETNVAYIRFSNLALKHCRVPLPPGGYISPQAEVNVPGAIHATGAQHCSFTNCTVSQVGGYGIELAAGCKDNVIDDCDLTDLGAGGIKLGDTRFRDAAHASEIAERNTVKNCFIAYGGRHYPAAIGVWLGHTPFNTIEHNEIFDFYYSGFSVGWSWGYGNSNAHHNTFAWNHVHKIGQGVLTDLAAIYSLGVSPGTTIHHNLFHDIESHDYGGWGIYFDEGSTGIVAENNIAYNCKSAGFHQHYGKENIVRNNIFAFGTDYQLMRTRAEDHLTVTVERNLIYYKNANLLGSNWTGGKFALDNNLYWDASGKPVLFGKLPLDEWRKKGYDQHSIIEDPLFVDADKYDFHLKPNSPASKIGFLAFDLAGVGPARARVLNENLSRAFPPRPAEPKLDPVTIFDDFENTPVGGKPAFARVSEENPAAVIRVSEETAASGKRSLKFTDAPGQRARFLPMMHYDPHYTEGIVECSFNLRMEPGAIFQHEWRTAGEPYKTGPSIHVEADGSFFVSGSKKLLSIPHGKWVKIELVAGVGKDASGTYTLSVTLPGAEKQTFIFACSKDFNALRWVGFVSNADAATVFYVDDVSVKLRK